MLTNGLSFLIDTNLFVGQSSIPEPHAKTVHFYGNVSLEKKTAHFLTNTLFIVAHNILLLI